MNTQAKEQPPEVIAVEMAKDREQRRKERQDLVAIPAADLAVSPLRTSFMPTSMGEAMQLATIMARSTFVPRHCRGNEGNCLAIIMQAGRWGMDPFAVANKAYFAKEDGPPAFEAQLVNAVVNSSGALSGRLRLEFEGEGEALRCTVRGFLRADPSDEKVRTQSIARVTTRNSPSWKQDPHQQMGYYVTRAWARLYCPEVLLGVYTPDELEIDPERARVVSPRLPRRDDPPHDAGTGEIYERDASGMTIVGQNVAEELDRQSGGQADDEEFSPLTDKDIGKYDDDLGREVAPSDVEQAPQYDEANPPPAAEEKASAGKPVADRIAEQRTRDANSSAPEAADLPPWQDAMDTLIDRLEAAATVKAVALAEQAWLNAGITFNCPDDHPDRAAADKAIRAAQTRVKQG